MANNILIVDDNLEVCKSLMHNFERYEDTTHYALNRTDALSCFINNSIDTVILDLRLGKENGLELLGHLLSLNPDIPIIILTGFATVQTAVESIKLGAYDYVQKPVNLPTLQQTVENAIKLLTFREKSKESRSKLLDATSKIITQNHAMIELCVKAKKLAKSNIPILILGESGTGKELIAEFIHSNSARSSFEIVKFNCSAFPETLIDNELFGHERGGFSGANTTFPGVFERAHRSTLFLDEIADMPLTTQAKILRAIQNQEIRRIGGKEMIRIDTRLIGATNKDLHVLMRENRFREDLYYHLNAAMLHVPPLRERKEDVLVLVEHFLQEFARSDILKYLYLQPKLLILDETLDNLKTETLHKVVNILDRLKRQGTAILCVTHKIDELYQIADKVTVIKDGEIFISDAVKNIDKINLIKFAYTEITKTSQLEISKEEFYQLLKYNEAILQNLPVNVLVLDNEIRIKLINEHTKSFFQLEHTEYYNLPLEQLFLSQNKEVYHLIREAVTQERVETFYNVMMYTRENPKRNNITINPIYDGAFLIGTMLIIEDISEQEQLREQMMFSEKLASTGLLAAGVAHEINNPLEIIHNYLEFLKYEIEEQKLIDILGVLQNQTETILQIVSNLIIFSDSTNINVELFDVNSLIEEIIGLIKFSARHKQITIHLKKESAILTLEANKTEIQQVILNLFKNSFDAMPSGGEIFITSDLIQAKGAHYVQITFMDTGPGICDENPSNIFLPFYSTKQGSENNLGLGLSVSYGIIQKYNGTIAVKNIDKTGCQFVIQLPQST